MFVILLAVRFCSDPSCLRFFLLVSCFSVGRIFSSSVLYIFAGYLWQSLFVLYAYAMPDIEISAINALFAQFLWYFCSLLVKLSKKNSAIIVLSCYRRACFCDISNFWFRYRRCFCEPFPLFFCGFVYFLPTPGRKTALFSLLLVVIGVCFAIFWIFEWENALLSAVLRCFCAFFCYSVRFCCRYLAELFLVLCGHKCVQ